MATVDAESPCPKCGGPRIKYTKSTGGLTSAFCRPCSAARVRKRYQDDPGAGSARTAAYYRANAELVRAKRRANYYNDPEKARAEAREYYRKNAERQAANSRRWREANPERQKELNERWRAANRERIKAYNADYYAKNRESEIARCIAYIKAHPEVDAAIKHRREARKRDVICEHGPKCVTSAFLKAIRAADCLYCGLADPTKGHADHFTPLSRGGLHCVENIVPACTHCNTSKHAMDPYDWLAGLKRST